MDGRSTRNKPTLSALRSRASRFVRDRRGATAVEYGFILALIVLAMIGALAGVGDVTVSMWNNINDKVTNSH